MWSRFIETHTDNLGIIFTDSSVLSDKYHCQRSDIEQLMKKFIFNSHGQGADWQLVDVGGNGFDYFFSDVIPLPTMEINELKIFYTPYRLCQK